jgi:aminomethyltransferase
MTLAEEVATLRTSVGLSRATHVATVRVDGPGAFDVLQRASTQAPYVREGRLRHTLLLREEATIFADVFIVKMEESFLVVAEGPTEPELAAWLERIRGTDEATVTGLAAEWTTFGVDGPYAWEAMGGLLGPPAVGLPYLAMQRREDTLLLRAGKTGEYGYLLFVPTAQASAMEDKLRTLGAALDLKDVSLEAIDVCALESWHFSMRHLGQPSLTPIELQLQSRVAYAREFVGAEAIRARRAEPKVRVTCFVAEKPVAPGVRVRIGERDVGEVLAACESPTLCMTVGSVLVERRFAHPHITFTAGDVPIRTCTSSLVANASMNIDPYKHSYATRGNP